MNRFCINQYQQGINGISWDYHIKRIGLKQLRTLKWGRSFSPAGIWTTAGGVRPEDRPDWMRNFKDLSFVDTGRRCW